MQPWPSSSGTHSAIGIVGDVDLSVVNDNNVSGLGLGLVLRLSRHIESI